MHSSPVISLAAEENHGKPQLEDCQKEAVETVLQMGSLPQNLVNSIVQHIKSEEEGEKEKITRTFPECPWSNGLQLKKS